MEFRMSMNLDSAPMQEDDGRPSGYAIAITLRTLAERFENFGSCPPSLSLRVTPPDYPGRTIGEATISEDE